MDDCIFCKIIKGDIPCYKLYEDENYLAFLDIQPTTKGHTLVLPKKHYANIYDIPEDVLCGLMAVAKKVALNIKDKLNPEAIYINQNNGEKAGQSIMHYHMHIKPIYSDTNFESEPLPRVQPSKEELEENQNLLRIN